MPIRLRFAIPESEIRDRHSTIVFLFSPASPGEISPRADEIMRLVPVCAFACPADRGPTPFADDGNRSPLEVVGLVPMNAVRRLSSDLSAAAAVDHFT